MLVSTDNALTGIMTEDHLEQYGKDGYTIIRGVFNEEEIAQMKIAIDKWKHFGELLGATWRKQNTIIWVEEEIVRGMQWPSYHDAILDRFRTDARMLEIIEPIIGNNIKQIINQVHWKKPGSNMTWPLHRDVRSRKPDAAFQDLYESWVQTGIAIDPHTQENGAMKIVPGSHLDVPHDPTIESNWNCPSYNEDPRTIVMELNPGDVGLWSAYTVHGGGFNTSKMDRRIYINGFVKGDKCTRGEWVWKNGRVQNLRKEQALIQFPEVSEQKQSFYIREKNKKEMISD